MNIPAMQAQMKARMDAEGLPFVASERLFPTGLAHELAKWAESKRVAGIHDALFRANFVERANVGDVEVLVGVAASLALPSDEAREVLSARTFRAAVEDDFSLARELGITGVPTYVVGNRGVVGAQPFEVLERLVVLAGAAKREAT
jgi:hypothetical protein